MSTKHTRPSAGLLISEAIVAFLILGAGIFFFCHSPAPQQPPEKDLVLSEQTATPTVESPTGTPAEKPTDPPAETPTKDPDIVQPSPDETASFKAISVTMEQLLDGSAETLAAASGANAIVVDMKPDSGRLNWVSQEPVAKNVGANSTVPEINRLLSEFLTKTDLYTVARMSAFRDDLVGYDWGCTVKGTNGARWTDDSGNHWSSLGNNVVRAYNARCAAELAELGFDEILLENVSSPFRGDLAAIPLDERFNDRAQTKFLTELKTTVEPTSAILSVHVDEATLADTAALPTSLTAELTGSTFDRVWLTEDAVDSLAFAGITAERVVTVVSTFSPASGNLCAVAP